MVKAINLTLGFLLLVGLIWGTFFPEWKFSVYELRIVKIAISPFITVWFLTTFLALRFKSNDILVSVGLWGSLIAWGIAYVSLKPLDSSSEPKEVHVVADRGNGEKIVAREYVNYKRNKLVQDTVTLEHRGIFVRRIN